MKFARIAFVLVVAFSTPVPTVLASQNPVCNEDESCFVWSEMGNRAASGDRSGIAGAFGSRGVGDYVRAIGGRFAL